MNEDTRNKDRLALVLSLVFVLALGFLGYRYFNSALPGFDGGERETSSTSTTRETEDSESNENGETQQDSTTGTTAGESTSQTGSTTFGELEEWRATDYEEGDIQTGNYTVQQGDTLWEVAEAAYGDGSQWVRILNANADDIGYLPNGQQALISTGQILVIPN